MSFVHGMPAGHPASDAVPGDGSGTPILVPEPIVVNDDNDDVQIIEPVSRAPQDVADFEVFTPPEIIGDVIPRTPRELLDPPSSPKGAEIPSDHLSKESFAPPEPMRHLLHLGRSREVYLLTICFVISRPLQHVMFVDNPNFESNPIDNSAIKRPVF